LAAEEGVVFPDQLVLHRGPARDAITSVLPRLRPGVTEILLHPAIDTPELRSFAPDWEARVDDHSLLTDGSLQKLVDEAGVTLIGYEPLRDLQRAEAA
jgi:hypothetical protein